MLFLILGGFRYFVVWSQITSYYEESPIKHIFKEEYLEAKKYPYKIIKPDNNFINQELKSEHSLVAIIVHSTRILLMSPIVYLSFLLKINPHLIFSFFAILLIIFTSIFLYNTYLLNSSGFYPSSFFCSIIAFFAFTFMNGRMLWALLAVSMLLFCMSTFHLKKMRFLLPVIFLSLLFSSVSTGVFAFSYILLSFYVLFYKKLYPSRSLEKSNYFSALILILFFFPYLILAIHKNVSFYGGEITAFYYMLSHGIFNVLLKNIFLAILAVLSFIYLSYLIKRSSHLSVEIKLCFYTFLISGVYGVGVFSMLLIPSILIFAILSDKYFQNYTGVLSLSK